MEKIKLYSENELFKAIEIATFFTPLTYKEVTTKLTPIELPSDEELRNELQFASNDYYFGAKWLLEQIKPQAE